MLSASCHCGAVRLEIARKPRQLTECNCSICRRYGARWAYYRRKAVRVLAGGSLAAYSAHGKALEFCFCGRCGCVLYHERLKKIGDATRIAVNARMMSPGEIASVRVRLLDGAATWKYLD